MKCFEVFLKALTVKSKEGYTTFITTHLRCILESLTLYEWRIQLGWDKGKLAEEAGLSRPAIDNAEEGRPIRAKTAKAIADALSKGYGREISVLSIKGLNVR